MDKNLDIDKNIEIKKASEDLKEKSSITYKAFKFYNETNPPKIILFLMRYSKIIKNEKKAFYIVLGIIILMFGLSFYFFFKDSFSKNNLPSEIIPDQSQFIQ